MVGLLSPQYQDADAAREHLEKLLWSSGAVCPQCGVIGEAYKLEADFTKKTKTHGRKGLWKCGACREQFTVTVGTIFEQSHIPLNKWLFAIHLMCSSKKGVSALQLQRELWGENPETKKPMGSYRTAWFMCHRVRWAMTQSPMVEALRMMGGTVEMKSGWVAARRKARNAGPDSKKTPVLALVERGGDVRSFPIERATLKNIKPILEQHIDPQSHLVTDESSVYYQMKPAFAKHSTVNHGQKEYVRKEGNFTVTTNTVESFFALLKRANYGIYHHMSRKYLGQLRGARLCL